MKCSTIEEYKILKVIEKYFVMGDIEIDLGYFEECIMQETTHFRCMKVSDKTDVLYFYYDRYTLEVIESQEGNFKEDLPF